MISIIHKKLSLIIRHPASLLLFLIITPLTPINACLETLEAYTYRNPDIPIATHNTHTAPARSLAYTTDVAAKNEHQNCSCETCMQFQKSDLLCTKAGSTPIDTIKPWTILVYMAADNDLRGFAARNIKQMAAIGSNENVNILVHLDIRIAGNQKVTRWYYIESAERIIHMNADDAATQKMDSGDPKTLITFCRWAMNNYPAHHVGLIFWNHGTGILDPERGRVINPSDLFVYNPITHKLDLDRSLGFFDIIEPDMRGVCWDDSTHNFLTNQKLDFALNYICSNILHRPFDLFGFDACLMSMIEIGNLLKRYAHVMVASQEVILGSGWNYAKALDPFLTKSPSMYELAANIVNAYHETYNNITNDYTLSAINLEAIDHLENNINNVADLLLECLKIQKNNSIKSALKTSRSKFNCTHFDELSYLDLADLYKNIQTNLKYFIFSDKKIIEGTELCQQLSFALQEGLELIKLVVFANTTGKNLYRAQGISIYFPEQRIHPSYPRNSFASSNAWMKFLIAYLVN